MRRSADRQAVVEVLLEAYRQGAFPMADPDTEAVSFYTSTRRGVFPLESEDGVHVSRSLRRTLRSGRFIIRSDTAFDEVMRGCAQPRPDDDKTWINATILDWFAALFEAGCAHCVEAWRRDPQQGRDRLVGGVYGLVIGGAFFGESMFSRPRPRAADGGRDPLDGTDASKVCLVRLAAHLRRRGYTLFDTQFTNPHLDRLGCVEISSAAYMKRLKRAVAMDVEWGQFT